MVEVEGDFELFADAFPNRLVPSVVEMVIREWPNCPRPTDIPLENRITNRLVGHLRRQMRNYDRPLFRFSCRPKLADPDADSELGEIDVEVTSFSNHPDAFLVLECKRLNVQTKSGFVSCAGEYVGSGGMGCFTSGQYKSGGRVGVMLAYVMTRSVEYAIMSVDFQLEQHGETLFMRAPFKLGDSTIIPNLPQVKQTAHYLSDGHFDIVHTFLKFSEN
jgi:hypothetical protein